MWADLTLSSETAISFTFDCLSVLTRVSEIYSLTFFRHFSDLVFFILNVVWNIYLGFCVDIFTLNLLWRRSILKLVFVIMFKLVWRWTREGNGSGIVGKSPLSRGSAPFSESEQSVPSGAFLHAPRSPSRAVASIRSPGTPRVDVWGGRGTVVVPRGVGRRTVETVPTGACHDGPIFKYP